MAHGDRKIGSLSYKEGNDTYNVVSVWESAQYPGSYSLSRDKENGSYKAMSIVDALRGFAAGRGYIDFRMQREQSSHGNQRQQSRGRQQQRQVHDEWDDDGTF